MTAASAKPTVLVVQHEPDTGPGWFGEWLIHAGVALDTVHPYAGSPLPGLAAYDGLLVLGGAMGPLDDDTCPWLPATRTLMASAVDSSLPTFGICLGGELLSVACGGSVPRGAHGPELGVLPVEVLAAAADDPVFGGLATTLRVVQWHWEEIAELPEGAVLLVTGDPYRHQAFRVGAVAGGVQGHPEVTADIAAAWAREDSPLLVAAGREPESLVAEVRGAEAELAAAWRPVAERFAGVVRAGAGRRLARH